MSWATLLTDGCSEAARTHVLTYGRPRITPRRDRCSTMLAPMSSEERSVLDRARADVVREECGARPCPRRRRPRRDRVAIRSRSSRDIERKACVDVAPQAGKLPHENSSERGAARTTMPELVSSERRLVAWCFKRLRGTLYKTTSTPTSLENWAVGDEVIAIQSRFSRDSVAIQSRYSRDTVATQSRHGKQSISCVRVRYLTKSVLCIFA